MTYIPGTGTINPQTPADEKNKNPSGESIISVVNVERIKNPEIDEKDLDEEIWFYQLKYWIAFGSIPSLIFAILTIYKWQFIFLTPIGPYAFYLAWHIRKKIKKGVGKFDVLG